MTKPHEELEAQLKELLAKSEALRQQSFKMKIQAKIIDKQIKTITDGIAELKQLDGESKIPA